jgi:hypothetical protein
VAAGRGSRTAERGGDQNGGDDDQRAGQGVTPNGCVFHRS